MRKEPNKRGRLEIRALKIDETPEQEAKVIFAAEENPKAGRKA